MHTDGDTHTFAISHRYPAFGAHIANELEHRHQAVAFTVECRFDLDNAQSLIARLTQRRVDVLVLDTEPGRGQANKTVVPPAVFVGWARELTPQMRVVALSDSDNSAFIANLLRAWVSAHIYMPRATMGDVMRAVNVALEDTVYLCPHSKQVMARTLEVTNSLTPREIEITRMLSLQPNSTFEQLAPQLFMSSGTLRAHLNNLRVKLGLASSDDIVPTARQFGWIE